MNASFPWHYVDTVVAPRRAPGSVQEKELALGTVPPGATLQYTIELVSLTKVRAARAPRGVCIGAFLSSGSRMESSDQTIQVGS